MGSILFCQTQHIRHSPVAHSFTYTLPFLLIRLDQLTAPLSTRFFKYNSRGLYSIYSCDYLHSGENLAEKLAKTPLRDIPLKKIWLLTVPRFLNHVFNPISLFLVAGPDAQWEQVLIEVTNTYKEKHLYMIPATANGDYLENTQAKTFHVSPFFEEKGHYTFRIAKDMSRIAIHIQYTPESKPTFYANLIEEKRYPMTDKSLLYTTFMYPGTILKTMPRILKEAAKLYYFKKIPVRMKPIPKHPDTIRPMPPSWTNRLAMRLILHWLKKIRIGALTLQLPDGQTYRFGPPGSAPAIVYVREYTFFGILLKKGEIGLGEAYMQGLWDTEDLTKTLRVLLVNKQALQHHTYGNTAHRYRQKIMHWIRRNTLTNSKKNIQAHYDLSNDFYKLFLDSGMNYSSALYRLSTDTLEEAQVQKLDRLIGLLRIKPHHHVLEIGSGWGAAALRLVEKTGCRVTTLTLSVEQHAIVTQRIQATGLSDRITVLLQDYRAHEGHYDRILSIEMIEAVGYDYLPIYFQTIDKLLAPNGLVAIQAITVPEQRYDRYRSRRDWIQTHIFPGGHLPSLGHIQQIIATTGLIIEDITNIAESYALTLAQWHKRFMKHQDAVRTLGFDDTFIRKWAYYLCYCEAGFRERYIGTHQLLLTRPMNPDLNTTNEET